MPEAVAEVRVQGVRRELGGLRRDVAAVQDSLDAVERRTQGLSQANISQLRRQGYPENIIEQLIQKSGGVAASGGGGRGAWDLSSQLARVGTQEKIASLQARELTNEWERNQRQTRAWREELERLERQLIRVQTTRSGGTREDEERIRSHQVSAGTMRQALAAEATQLRVRAGQLGMRPGGPVPGEPGEEGGGGGGGGQFFAGMTGGALSRFATPFAVGALIYAGVRRALSAQTVAYHKQVQMLQSEIPLMQMGFGAQVGEARTLTGLGFIPRDEIAAAQMRMGQATGQANVRSSMAAATLSDLDYQGSFARTQAMMRMMRRPREDVAGRVFGLARGTRGFGVAGAAEFAEATTRLGTGIVSPFTGINPGDVGAQIRAAGEQLPPGMEGGLARTAATTKVQDIYNTLGAEGGLLQEVKLRTLAGLRGTAVEKALRGFGININEPQGLLEAAQRFPELVTNLRDKSPVAARMLMGGFTGTLGQLTGENPFMQEAILREGTGGDWRRAREMMGGNMEAIMQGMEAPAGGIEETARRMVGTAAGGKITAAAVTPTEMVLSASDQGMRDLGETLQRIENVSTGVFTQLPGIIAEQFDKIVAAVKEEMARPLTEPGLQQGGGE